MENYESTDQVKYERARKRVRAVSGFYRHLMVYVVVNVFLVAMKYFNLDAGEKFFTFSTFSTAFFWGIGLVFHGFGVFHNNVFFGKNWEEKKIQEIMEKDKKQKWE
jgi:hypothetical protein